MPETEKIELEEVTKQDKKDVLDAVIIDMLADELPPAVQEKLPNGGNTIVQAPGDKLTVKTSGIVNEISKIKLEAPGSKPVKSVMGTATVIATVVQHIDKNKAANAGDVLKYLGDEFIRDGKLMQEEKFTVPNVDMGKLRKGMKIAGKALIGTGKVLLTASKAATFFSRMGK